MFRRTTFPKSSTLGSAQLEMIVASGTDQYGTSPAEAHPGLRLSPRRLALLQQAGIEPDALLPADVDETPLRSESPRELVRRLARTKAEVARKTARNRDELRGRLHPRRRHGRGGRHAASCRKPRWSTKRRLACGCSRGGRTASIPPFAWSRRRTRCANGWSRRACGSSACRASEIEGYLASGEWRGKAGGYAIQGLAGAFVVKLVGSYTNVVGLPLYETIALLDGEGFPVRSTWLEAVRTPDIRRWPPTSRNARERPPPARSAASRPLSAARPFCSARCADIDLGRWLGGRYAIPVAEDGTRRIEAGLRGERRDR